VPQEGNLKSYIGERRENGCGNLRLGSIFSYNEGIYTVLYIANFKREYFKLSLYNEQVKVKLTLAERTENGTTKRSRILTGHRKSFKGIAQSIKNDETQIFKQFVYLDHLIDDEFIYDQ
jgi:hypothetical protein